MSVAAGSLNNSREKKKKKKSNMHDDRDLPVFSPRPAEHSGMQAQTTGTCETHLSSGDTLKDIFHMGTAGYDVTLSIGQKSLTWMPITCDYVKGENYGKTSKRAFSGLFGRSSASETARDKTKTLDLENVFGIKIKRRRKAGQEEGEGVCLGLALYTFERKSANKLRDKLIVFEHPSESLCCKWAEKIQDVLKDYHQRPKSITVFCQPYAGSKSGRRIYRSKAEPIFKTADIEISYAEIGNAERIQEKLKNIKLSAYDFLVVIGGDGTVRKAADALLCISQITGPDLQSVDFPPSKAVLPLGIIPTGTTNHIAHSVMGVADPVTATILIVLGRTHPVDVCSIRHEDNHLLWAFNGQYGFAGSVLKKRQEGIRLFGINNMEIAFVKALTKPQLRAYECEVDYIPVSSQYSMPCRTGCSVCSIEKYGDQTSMSSDVVEELDPLNTSGTSSTITDLTAESPWRTCKGEYLNVGLFCLPSLCDMAPQGLSKFTHLADGTMDLVLVKSVERKEFLHFLKRHATSKNQFDLPFVETHKVKRVRFRPRYPTTWTYINENYSEIEYEVSKTCKKFSQSSDPILNSDPVATALDRKPESLNDIRFSDGDEEAKESDGSSEEDKKSKDSKLTYTERDQLSRKKMKLKKEEKKRMKAEARAVSAWNIDNELCFTLELEFRVHQALLLICGEGVSPSTNPEETMVGCLPL